MTESSSFKSGFGLQRAAFDPADALRLNRPLSDGECAGVLPCAMRPIGDQPLGRRFAISRAHLRPNTPIAPPFVKPDHNLIEFAL
ncbi:MAG: hypothetical protein ACSHW1_20345 [Yoonia sp.]